MPEARDSRHQPPAVPPQRDGDAGERTHTQSPHFRPVTESIAALPALGFQPFCAAALRPRVRLSPQAEAERRKRATVLSSEGDKQSEINRAEGQKQRVILESEAAMLDSINRAKGEAEAILQRAHATAESVTAIAAAIGTGHGPEAVQMRVAEQYIEAFGRIAKAGTTVLLPSGAADPAAMVAQALAIYKARDRIVSGSANAVSARHGGADTVECAHCFHLTNDSVCVHHWCRRLGTAGRGAPSRCELGLTVVIHLSSFLASSMAEWRPVSDNRPASTGHPSQTGGSVAASAGAPTGQAAGPLGFAASGVPDQRAPRAAAHTPLPARSLRKESYAGDREE